MDQVKTHAAYGTACTNCSKTKCRCVVLTPGEACERCRRLNKDCVVGGTRRKRNARKGAVSQHQLEAKIDGLVSLLISGDGKSVHPVDASQLSLAGITPPSGREWLNQNTTIPPTLSATESSKALRETLIVGEDGILKEFCELKLRHFPFMHIPDGISASEVRGSKPFLWLCIVAVSAKSTAVQSKLYAHIRRILGQAMVGELERTLEQLLGLLVCLAWGNFQVHRRPFLTLFMQLSMSVVFDLGLNKSPPRGKDEKAKYRFHKPWISANRTMEERRAVLGCYLMSSHISSYLDRIDTLRMTEHMNESLQVLAANKECPRDSTLVILVRLQRIIEKSRTLSMWNEESFLGERPPVAYYTKALQAELDDIETQILLDSLDLTILQCHLYYTRLKIYEYALLSPTKISEPLDFIHIDSLYSCFSAVESYFEAFFKFSPAEYIGFTTPSIFQLTHCAFCLYQLSALQDPAWNRDMVVRTLDIAVVGQRVAQNFKDAVIASGMQCDGEEDMLTRLGGVVESATRNWEAKLREQTGEAEIPPGGIVDMDIPVGNFSSALDEFWLNDLMTPLEWEPLDNRR